MWDFTKYMVYVVIFNGKEDFSTCTRPQREYNSSSDFVSKNLFQHRSSSFAIKSSLEVQIKSKTDRWGGAWARLAHARARFRADGRWPRRVTAVFAGCCCCYSFCSARVGQQPKIGNAIKEKKKRRKGERDRELSLHVRFVLSGLDAGLGTNPQSVSPISK